MISERSASPVEDLEDRSSDSEPGEDALNAGNDRRFNHYFRLLCVHSLHSFIEHHVARDFVVNLIPDIRLSLPFIFKLNTKRIAIFSS